MVRSILLIALAISLAASHIHREELGDSRVTVCRFASMNGLESSRYLFRQEVLTKYPVEELNVDVDYLGRALTEKVDYYVVRVVRGGDVIRCFGTDPVKTADPPRILWDTAVEAPDPFR